MKVFFKPNQRTIGPKSMNRRNRRLFGAAAALVSAFILSATAAHAQSAYFHAVTNLNPVGYWPMHEIEPATPGDIETNYGSLGPLGTGYYPDWISSGSAIVHQVPGALAGDSDTAAYFGTYNGNTFTNELFVPHTVPASTLTPPFSIECWFNTTNASSGNDIWSQMGNVGLNGGLYNAGGKTAGVRLFVTSSSYTLYTYDPGKNNLISSSLSAANPAWCHIVVTCDANTNFAVYVDGVLSKTNAGVNKYTPDYWTPFEVGNGLGNTRAMDAYIDEVAIYTNVITDIAQHYSDGINPAPATSYYQDVINDQPVIYLRMDGPAYTPPSAATWSALTNYGSVGVNGVYSPGTMPGIVSGPANPGGVPFAGETNPVPELGGVSSFADAGYATQYDPTGAKPFSVIAMFRGNPCDGRTNAIVGHSDNSWRIFLDPFGHLNCRLGIDAGAAITTTNIYNDGNWHQLVAVYHPNSNPLADGTNALYVDGVLDTMVATVGTNGIEPGTNLDVIIGSDPAYTNDPAGVGEQFAGQVCDVALFTNALSTAQVRALYDAAGEQTPPYIVQQPAPIVSGGKTLITMTANGTDPLAYQWYFNTTLSYDGATPETDGGGVSGSTAANLTITNLHNYYFVVVTNNYGSVTSAIATANFAPVIVAQVPTTYTNLYTIYPGFNQTFSVSAVGDSLAYQWYENGTGMPGATGASFTQSDVQASFSISCIVTNSYGSATSTWAATVISLPTAPYPQSVLALDPVAYWRMNEPDNNGGNGPNDGVVCHDYISGNDGLYTNAILGQSGYNPTSDPSDTSVAFGNTSSDNDVYAIGTNIDFATPSGNNGEFSMEAWVNLLESSSGALVAKGYNGGEEASLDMGGPSDSFRFLVRNAGGAAYTASSGIVPVPGLWYHVVGVCDEASGAVSVYVNGALAGSTNVASGGGILNNAAWPMTIGSKAASATGANTIQTFAFMNDVAVFGYALSAGQVAAQYDAGGGTVAPYFVPAPPTNAYAISNTTLTVSATAVGSPLIGFQWINLTTSTTIATGVTNGATLAASLSYNNVPSSWNGDELELIVTNAYGSTNITIPLTVGGYPQSSQEDWTVSSGGYTNTLDWAPRIVTPGAITNWPDDPNGNGFDYVAILTNNTGHISCLYTNTDANGTNLIGQLAIGGYGAGQGGGDVSNAFIMTGGQLSVTDFTASASAGYAFTVGGTTVNAVASTNYFVMNGGTFNSTNASGGNNWVGYASNTVNEVDINGGTVNLDGMFIGGCGSNTININGGIVNLVRPPGGGGAAGVINAGWNTNGNGSLNLMAGTLNANCTNNAPSINLGANRGGSGFFTFNVSGGTLNAYQIGVGAATGNGTSQVTGPETNLLNVSGGTINLGAGGITNTIADQHDTNLVILSGGTLSTLAPDNYTPGTTTGNWTLWRGVNLAYVLGTQPGPGIVNFAPLSGATITASAPLTGNGGLNAAGPGTLILASQSSYTGNTFITGGTLSLTGVGAIPNSTNIIMAGGATFDVSGASSTFTLGSSQVLSNSTSTPIINGNVDSGSGTLSLTYTAGMPSFAVANGTLMLSAGTVLYVDNAGTALGPGTYTLIGANAGGAVGGAVPSSVTVYGGGVANGDSSSLIISSSNTLDLVVSSGSGVNTTSTNITFSVTGNQLTLAWPADHTGWTLQAQTNSLSVGVSTNWADVAGSTTTNKIIVPISTANGCVFYRLEYTAP